MANSTLTAVLTLSYTDADGTAKSSSVTVAAPYQAMSEGMLDVPSGLASAQVLAIPFGTIAKATGFWVKNNTANGVNAGHDLTIKVNGGAAIIDLAPGAEHFFAAPATTAGNSLASATLTTTAIQVGNGSIGFRVFGDPT